MVWCAHYGKGQGSGLFSINEMVTGNITPMVHAKITSAVVSHTFKRLTGNYSRWSWVPTVA